LNISKRVPAGRSDKNYSIGQWFACFLVRNFPVYTESLSMSDEREKDEKPTQ